jgi:hypothetical protein
VDSLLSVSPGLIKHIDLVNRVYIRGNNTYGGIISIISRNGDLAGEFLREGTSFFRFGTFNSTVDAGFPDYQDIDYNKRIPDLRTTLFWNPRQEVAASRKKPIEFYTSDISGTYIALVRGVTPEGDIIEGSCEFRVE